VRITFSADDDVPKWAHRVARSEGKNLEDAFREWLETYASPHPTRQGIEELLRSLKYAGAARKFTRDEMNERR
jgi:thiaminase